MSPLGRKRRRDLRRALPTTAAVVLLVLAGVALFTGAYEAYRNLERSYDEVFDRTSFASLTVVGGDVETLTRDADARPGVAATRVRSVAEVPVGAAGERLTGRVVGLPAGQETSVNDVVVLDGRRRFEGRGEVLVEQHLARTLALSLGDELTLAGGRARSAGIVASPEYLWPARSGQDVFPDPRGFGVLFAPERRVAALPGATREALVRYDAGADGEVLTDTLTRRARELGALDVVPRAAQPSNAVLSEDIQSFGALAVLFPVLFLSAAGLAVAVVLRQRVRRERSLIGTMRALGIARRTVLRHYLGTGLVLGLAGSVPGVAVGLLLARELTEVYTSAIDLPLVRSGVSPETLVVGLTFGPLAGALAAWLPARAASRVAPAAAMRGIVPAGGGRRGLLERVVPGSRYLPARWRLVLRAPDRHPARTLTTVLGVVLAAVLVLSSWGFLEAVDRALALQYGEVDRADARVLVAGPTGPVLERLAGVDGVARVEPSVLAQVSLRAGERRTRTTLDGLDPQTRLHGFTAPSGEELALPDEGLMLDDSLRDQLEVGVGDEVEVRTADGSATLPVRGIVEEPLGGGAYAARTTVARLPGREVTSALIAYDAGADRAALRTRVSAVDGVATYQDVRAVEELVRGEFAGLLYGFIGAMLALGLLLGGGILFTVLTVGLDERAGEVATLRASGARFGDLARLLSAETLLLAFLGLVPGLAAGWFAARGALAALSSDQWSFPATLGPVGFLVAAGGLLAAALVAQLPGLLALRRVDIAAVVRERAA